MHGLRCLGTYLQTGWAREQEEYGDLKGLATVFYQRETETNSMAFPPQGPHGSEADWKVDVRALLGLAGTELAILAALISAGGFTPLRKWAMGCFAISLPLLSGGFLWRYMVIRDFSTEEGYWMRNYPVFIGNGLELIGGGVGLFGIGLTFGSVDPGLGWIFLVACIFVGLILAGASIDKPGTGDE